MAEALTVIYGLHAVAAALEREPGQIRELWVEDRRHDGRIQRLLAQATHQGAPVRRVARIELEQLCSGARHQGVAARLAQSGHGSGYQEADLPGLLPVHEPALVLALDGVQDPHNLGACLRSAAAAGAHAVIAPTDRAVGLNATVRKVACGAADLVPFVPVTNLVRTLRSLRERGLWLTGAAGEAADTLYQIDFTQPTVIVTGAEDQGLRRLTRETCDRLARIPMATGLESLNVSVATGIFLFEARRQRGGDFLARVGEAQR